MDPNDVLPIRFTITPHARVVITDVQKQWEAHVGQKAVAAAVGWGNFHFNNGDYVESVIVGYFEEARYETIKHAIEMVSGIPVIFIATEKDAHHFDGKVLDHDPERGYFMREP